jgi:hypothetical protein
MDAKFILTKSYRSIENDKRVVGLEIETLKPIDDEFFGKLVILIEEYC